MKKLLTILILLPAICNAQYFRFTTVKGQAKQMSIFDSANVRFSGALMPNNAAGTSGDFFISGGAGGPNIWQTGVLLNKLTAATGTNSIDNTSFGQTLQWNTLNSSAIKLSTTSTAATSINQRMLEVAMTGVNSTSSAQTYGLFISNKHTGTTSTNRGALFDVNGATTNYGIDAETTGAGTTNIAGYFASSSGTNNYGIIVPSGGGSVGIGNSAPTSTLDITGGSIAFNYVAKTANYTLTGTDNVVDATSGTFTLTLPTAVGVTGRVYTIKNSGTGVVTIATTSSQTIDGVTTKTVNVQYSGYKLISDGSNYKIIGTF